MTRHLPNRKKSKMRKLGPLCLVFVVVVFQIRSYFPTLDEYYSALTRQEQNVKDSTRTTRVVISLKTIPSRIAYIEPTLNSLLNQSRVADAIYLVLPKRSFFTKIEIDYDIPQFVIALVEQQKLTLLRPDWDFGAVDKLLHTLEVEREGNTKILYLDDDNVQHESLVETLYHKSLQYPGTVVAFSGAILRSQFRQVCHSDRSKDRHPCLYFHGPPVLNNDTRVDIVQGFAGVMVSRTFFNPKEFGSLILQTTNGTSTSIMTPKIAFQADDFLISGYLEKCGIQKYVVAGGIAPLMIKKAAKMGALSSGMHNKIIATAFFLQQNWDIWTQFEFLNPALLTQLQQAMIDCEANGRNCPPGLNRGNVGKALDIALNVSSTTRQ